MFLDRQVSLLTVVGKFCRYSPVLHYLSGRQYDVALHLKLLLPTKEID